MLRSWWNPSDTCQLKHSHLGEGGTPVGDTQRLFQSCELFCSGDLYYVIGWTVDAAFLPVCRSVICSVFQGVILTSVASFSSAYVRTELIGTFPWGLSLLVLTLNGKMSSRHIFLLICHPAGDQWWWYKLSQCFSLLCRQNHIQKFKNSHITCHKAHIC